MVSVMTATDTERVQLEARNGHTVASIAGELAYHDLDQWVPALGEALSASGSRVIVDLSQVEHVDSAALGNLVALVAQSNTNSCRVILAAPSPYVSGVLEVTRLDTFFEVCDSISEAESRLALEC